MYSPCEFTSHYFMVCAIGQTLRAVVVCYSNAFYVSFTYSLMIIRHTRSGIGPGVKASIPIQRRPVHRECFGSCDDHAFLVRILDLDNKENPLSNFFYELYSMDRHLQYALFFVYYR